MAVFIDPRLRKTEFFLSGIIEIKFLRDFMKQSGWSDYYGGFYEFHIGNF